MTLSSTSVTTAAVFLHPPFKRKRGIPFIGAGPGGGGGTRAGLTYMGLIAMLFNQNKNKNIYIYYHDYSM